MAGPDVAIRPERPGDEAAIHALTDAAFRNIDDESAIVDRLRGSDRWIADLSLVAVAPDGTIVGHCLTSIGDLVAADGTVRPILALGPISVSPDRQGEGIGGELIRVTIATATARGWPAIVLLGHATYYPRFGFEPARALGIEPERPWSDEHWMVLRLPGWTPDLRGTMHFPSAFRIEWPSRARLRADGIIVASSIVEGGPMTTSSIADADARRDALAERVFAAILGSLDVQVMYLGERLGLYTALAEGGPATAPQLAERAGIDARYAREWLEHQAVGGVLEVDDVDADPDARRYTLPPGHAEVLIDPESLALLAPLTRFMIGTAQRMPDVVEAYRTGAGIDWADYGPDVIEAQEAMNRPHFRHHVGAWIDDLPDVAARLRAGTGRVADIACGTGWSSISIAQHFPGVAVDGIDIDPGSIERARANAAAEGVADRVGFLFADAAAAEGAGRYDLVTIFEALHDMSRPAEVLAAARALLAPGGAVLVADERVAERFTAPGDEAERLFYGFSVVGCLVNGRFDQPSVATGTVMRPSAVEGVAREAGFTRFTILPTEHENFRFYRLDP